MLVLKDPSGRNEFAEENEIKTRRDRMRNEGEQDITPGHYSLSVPRHYPPQLPPRTLALCHYPRMYVYICMYICMNIHVCVYIHVYVT